MNRLQAEVSPKKFAGISSQPVDPLSLSPPAGSCSRNNELCRFDANFRWFPRSCWQSGGGFTLKNRNLKFFNQLRVICGIDFSRASKSRSFSADRWQPGIRCSPDKSMRSECIHHKHCAHGLDILGRGSCQERRIAWIRPNNHGVNCPSSKRRMALPTSTAQCRMRNRRRVEPCRFRQKTRSSLHDCCISRRRPGRRP